MHLARRRILRRQVKSDIDGRIDQLETHILDAQQVQPGKLPGNRVKRVLLRRVVHLQPSRPEHRNLEGYLLNLRFRHPFEPLQCTEAVGKGIRPLIAAAFAKGLLGNLAPALFGSLAKLPGRIEGKHFQIGFVGLIQLVFILKGQTKIQPG